MFRLIKVRLFLIMFGFKWTSSRERDVIARLYSNYGDLKEDLLAHDDRRLALWLCLLKGYEYDLLSRLTEYNSCLISYKITVFINKLSEKETIRPMRARELKILLLNRYLLNDNRFVFNQIFKLMESGDDYEITDEMYYSVMYLRMMTDKELRCAS